MRIYQNPSEAVAAVHTCPTVLRYVPDHKRSEAVLIAAVSGPNSSLQPIPMDLIYPRTHAIAMAAAQNKGLSEFEQEFRTFDVCLAAVTENGLALREVPAVHRTTCILLQLRPMGWGLELIVEFERNEELCFTAVRQCGSALEFVPAKLKTAPMCWAAIEQDGNAMDFIPDDVLTFEMCLAAVKQTGGENELCVPYRFRGRVSSALRDEEVARRQEETTFIIRDGSVFEFNERTRQVGACIGRLSKSNTTYLTDVIRW